MINRLDVYIHDYLVKRDLKASAQAFQAEGKVSSDPVGKTSTTVHKGNYDMIILIMFTLWIFFTPKFRVG